MTDADPFSLGNTPEKSNSSNGSVNETDLTAHSPVQPSSESSSKSLLPIKKPSYLPLKMEGGNLAEISKNITAAISKGKSEAMVAATARFISRNAHGFAGGIAMRCQGPECPIQDICPFTEAKEAYPVGDICPFEDGIVQMWVNKHLTALGIDNFDAPESSFDLDLLYELAGHELIKWRAAQHLSKKGTIIDERQIAMSLQGDQIFGEVMSPALEALDIQSKITMKLRDALLATRKAQIQAGRDMGDHSKKSADLAKRAREKALERLGINQESIKDGEYEVKE